MREKRHEKRKDFKAISEIAVSAFMKGDFTSFSRELIKLETLKMGTIASLRNQEEQIL